MKSDFEFYDKLAKVFGVSWTQINSIKKKKSWEHFTDKIDLEIEGSV